MINLKIMKKKLTEKQQKVIAILKQYPNEMIMHNGWLTGGHGIEFDMRTIESLKKRKIIVDGRLNKPITFLNGWEEVIKNIKF